jgi:3-oxoadipate enol-lactonase
MVLHWEEQGVGPPVLLVHAGICDRTMWDPQWATFPGAHRTLRCDLRGFGRSPLPPERYSPPRDIEAVLDAAGVGRWPAQSG